jgi:hypothetical protein
MDNFMTYGHRWIHEIFGRYIRHDQRICITVDESILTGGIS